MKTLVIAGIINVHKQILIRMIFLTMMLNAVHATIGVYEVYSPREIVTHQRLDMNKYFKVRFGRYVEASEYACPSGNWQSSTMCFNLNSGVVVTRRTVTPLPMLDRIKKLVNRWGMNPGLINTPVV